MRKTSEVFFLFFFFLKDFFLLKEESEEKEGSMEEESEKPFCEKCVRKVPLLSSSENNQFDIVIVGGGLAGCWTAYWLNKRAPKSKIAIVESLPDIMEGKGWNSPSIVNAGSLSETYDGESITREMVKEIAVVKWQSFIGRMARFIFDREVFGRLSLLRFDDIGVAVPKSIYSLSFLCSFVGNVFFPASRRDPPNFSYSQFFHNIEEQSIHSYRTLSNEMKESLGVTFPIYSERLTASLSLTKTALVGTEDPKWLTSVQNFNVNLKDISLNSDRFLRMFHTFLMKKNVSFYYDTTVSEVSTSDQQVVGLKTSSGNVVATSMYVFCTGAAFHPIMNRWTFPAWGLCRDYEYRVKNDISLLIPKTTTVEDPHHLYFLPRGKTGVRVTSGFFLSQSPPNNSHLMRSAVAIDKRTEDVLPSSVMSNLRLSSATIQYGARPVTPDGRPVIGAHPDFRNAYIVNGFGMFGHSSAVLCRMLCDMMTGRLNQVEKVYGCSPDVFSPSRFVYGDFAIRWMSRWGSVKEKVFSKGEEK